MEVTITVPDELAAALAKEYGDPARAVLETVALKAYRERRISAYQLRTMLGIRSRVALDAFLKERQIETYTPEDFARDLAGLDDPPATAPAR